jgi:hypothetical protein
MGMIFIIILIFTKIPFKSKLTRTKLLERFTKTIYTNNIYFAFALRYKYLPVNMDWQPNDFINVLKAK